MRYVMHRMADSLVFITKYLCVFISITIPFMGWSYYSPVVIYEKVKVRQIDTDRQGYVRLQLSKAVNWYRLCRGIARQSITPLIEGGRGITSPIPLASHAINIPPEPGRYSGFRPEDIYINDPLLPAGRYRYNLCADMVCWPWDDYRPIESDCTHDDFEVREP